MPELSVSESNRRFMILLSRDLGRILGRVASRIITSEAALEEIRFQYPVSNEEAGKTNEVLERLARSELRPLDALKEICRWIDP